MLFQLSLTTLLDHSIALGLPANISTIRVEKKTLVVFGGLSEGKTSEVCFPDNKTEE